MIGGIKQSVLVSNLLEGNEERVPIGQKIITNTVKSNSKDLMPRTAGQKLTSLHIDQFDVFGAYRQSKATKRDDAKGDVSYAEREIINDGLIVDAAFDAEGGVVNMVRKNAQVLMVDGLLTQGDFGTGPTGPKGEPGHPGYDGFDGNDGPTGPTGCAGPNGGDGPQGEMGQAGADGPQGIPGPMGGPGPEGIQGQDGDMGRYGHEGARGARGIQCDAEPGSTGTPGAAANTSVVISASEPDNLTVLWGLPD
jgi:hypothetical protein